MRTAVLPVTARPKEVCSAHIEALYRQHHQKVFALALRYGGGNKAWAEDTTQDVFLELVNRLDRLKDTGDLGAWLYRVTTNRCLNRLRNQAMREKVPLVWLLGRSQLHEIEVHASCRAELQRAWRIVETLPAVERIVFCMVHLDGLSQVDVAQVLGVSKGYVSRLVKRSRCRIQAALGEREEGAGA